METDASHINKSILLFFNKEKFMDSKGKLYSIEQLERELDQSIAFSKLPEAQRHEEEYVSHVKNLKTMFTKRQLLMDFSRTLLSLNIYILIYEDREMFEICAKCVQNIKIEIEEQFFALNLIYGAKYYFDHGRTLLQLKDIARNKAKEILPNILEHNKGYLTTSV